MIKNLDEYLEMRAERNEVVGSWGFNSHLNFTNMSSEETNIWFFEQVFNFLRSFFGLVVPDSMEVITYNASKQIKKGDLNQQTFLDELMLVMKGLKEHLWTIRINLNIVGFLRTDHNPDDPVRLQIKEPCSFIVWGGPDESGFQSFSITYNLFSKTVLEGQDQMLWSINQPVLEKALKKWEAQTGQHIDVVDSNSDHVPVQKYGFGAPRTSAYKPPKPPPGKDVFNFMDDSLMKEDDFSEPDFAEDFPEDDFPEEIEDWEEELEEIPGDEIDALSDIPEEEEASEPKKGDKDPFSFI